MSLATLPKTVRTFARLRVIAQVLTKHGFGHFVDRMQLGSYSPVRLIRRRKAMVDETESLDPMEAVGTRLVKVCEELGPTFIKLGQIASTRADLLPTPILTALENLQADVQPFPTEQVKRIFQKDTGTSVDEAFKEFTDAPLASGSIGQIHQAVAKNGQKVVVKVKRPGIDQTIRLDIYVMKFLAEQAESLFPELRPYRPIMLVEEFTQTLQRELDFINEASVTSRFHEAFKDDPHIRTPQVRWDLTGTDILTLEFMDGLRFREVTADNGPGYDRRSLAQNLAECFLKQYFEMGLFHADPHPGNIQISSPDNIELIDFGMVGHIDESLNERLVIGIVAAVRKEIDVVIDVLADVNALGPNTDRHLLNRDLRAFLDKYYGLPLSRLDMSTIFRELIETVRRNDVTLPRESVALLKSLAVVSGVVLQLDPEFNLFELLKPRLSKLIREQFSSRRLLRTAGVSTWHIASILRDAPRLIRELMRGMGRGRFQVNIKHENLDYLAKELDRSSNRLASAVIMASTIICGTMLLSMEADVEIFGIVPIRYLGFVGYAIASFMAVWLVVAILRSGKLS
ncbi:MAG: AarF/ABC1/UbiB kinase family protein [Phycisphaerales bacterium]|nr:AarF/ABC1/UbiB kinase family protein [Phycisphaerales bacterium]